MELAFLPQKIFMQRALELANEAFTEGEVPVGAVIEKDGKIIGEGRNCCENEKNALCHAELIAIDKACRAISSWRLSGCRLYVTLEPCAMCMGAAINSRINTVVFAAYDGKAGCCGGICNLPQMPFDFTPGIFPGFFEEEATALLKRFFKEKRKKV